MAGQQSQDQTQGDQPRSKSDQTIRNLRIHIDRQLCIGAATCIAIAPKAFNLDNEAKAIILPTASEETDETLIDAARACPVAAIIVTERDTGKQIFP